MIARGSMKVCETFLLALSGEIFGMIELMSRGKSLIRTG